MVNMDDPNETVDSFISYIGGGSLVTGAMYADLTNGLHLIALVLGVIVIGIRCIHDFRKLRKSK